MLNALQKKIDALILDPDDPLELWIKKRLRNQPPKGLADDLREFIRLIPKMERRIYALYVWLPQDSKVKEVSSYFLTYMYKPDDFIPENECNGLFGFLDDAYLASLFYELMVEEIESSNQTRIRREDIDLVRKVIGYRRKATAVIPEEAIKIRQMVGELFAGDETAFKAHFTEKK